MLRILPLLITFGFMQIALAQNDSVFLKLNQLQTKDLIETVDVIGSQKVVSASRSLKALEDLPFNIYVVTQEEIFKNGYTTLVDVLKNVPGIRVSQPGSALDGETFLMRGLYGNSYAKILINDIPIKPTAVGGMPIGAQIPIRQAERIEIIFGPAAAVYGADASAGVINIILKETEKPLFTRADLSIGVNGYNDLNVMFGGRIGKGKNILKFSMYGSNTVFDDRNTKYDNQLYNPQLYGVSGTAIDSSYLKNPNYRGTLNRANLNTLPHLSRMFGVNLRFRALSFSFNQMYRRDHSAIGLSPYSVTYSNPLNYIGETISQFNFGIRKNFKKFGFNANLTVLNYNMDDRSSYTYVNNTLWRFLDLTVTERGNTPEEKQELRSSIYDRIFSNTRFSFAQSTDGNAEALFTFRPFSGIELVAGANAQYSYNQPIINYLARPQDANLLFGSVIGDSTNVPFRPIEEYFYTLGAFAQAYVTLKKFNLMMGMRYDQTELFGDVFNPRIAFQFKPAKDFSLRLAFATAFRSPTTFYGANTYTIIPGDLNSLQTASFESLSPENTFSYEFGMRLNNSKRIYADASFFYSITENIISFNFNSNLDIIDTVRNELKLGYFNDEASQVKMYGVQSRLLFKDLIPAYKLNAELNFNYTIGEEELPFNKGKLDFIRMQPKTLTQLNISMSPGRRFFFSFKNTYSSSFVERFVVDENQFFRTAGFYTLDMLIRYELNRNFQIYLDIDNFFSEEYGGIGATGFADDLFYNPQPQRTIRFGLSYTMN